LWWQALVWQEPDAHRRYYRFLRHSAHWLRDSSDPPSEGHDGGRWPQSCV